MPSRRAERWRIKTSPELLHPKLEALHELSSNLIAAAYTSIDQLYQAVSRVLDENGVSINQRLLYRSYMEELWKLMGSGRGKAQEAKCGAIVVKYWLYGGDRKILYSIASLMGLGVDYLDRVIEEASYMTVKQAVKEAIEETIGSMGGETITICIAQDISTGVEAPLKNYERWTLYLKTQGAIVIDIYLSPDDGSTWYKPKESPVTFDGAGDDIIEFDYDATRIKLVGSNTTPVTAQVRGVF